MSNIINDEEALSKERFLLAICLIMIKEHNIIDLQELINATGLSFQQVRQAMHNLSMLKLIQINPSFRGVPKFQIINDLDANKFLKQMGF